MKKLALIIFILPSLLSGSKIKKDLLERLNELREGENVRAIVVLKEQVDLTSLTGMTKREKISLLKEVARSSQKELIEWLRNRDDVKEIRSFFSVNAISISASKEVIKELLLRDEVQYIEEDSRIVIEPPLMGKKEEGLRTVEWNVHQILADSVWSLGYTGEGVIVGNIDTGVDVDHPALQGKWLGYWFDATLGWPTPYDDVGHGTHTMGTILGGDGPGPFTNDIGVAPGANFVAAKGFLLGIGLESWLLACFDWYLDLIDQGVNVRVVSNSWGSCDETSTTFWQAVLSWRGVGIIPVFAIGNAPNCGYPEPPPYGTAGTPGNFPTVIGVGATNSSDDIASFSLRGPAPNSYPWNDETYWGRPDWNLIKPDISAPGVNIRSSVPGGGYEIYSGTSMACPHIAGVIALMLSKNPEIDYYTVYNTILDNAYHPPQGSPYPNNNYGWGRVNALEAVLSTPPTAVCGDANGDGEVSSADALFILNWITGGPQPVSCWAANVNGDEGVNASDAIYLLNWISGGPELNCGDCQF